ncbi:homeobox domain-containing protein [Apiospora arundinis]
MTPFGSRHVSTTNTLPQKSESQGSPITKDYQDEDETHDSKLKSLWDSEMGDPKSQSMPYAKVSVLLLSWHKDIYDLNTGEEVADLETLFKEKFMFETTKRVLTRDSRNTAQSQVNYHLSEFVIRNDDVNTLLIVYYAGHGRQESSRPGSVRSGGDRKTLKLTASTSLRGGVDTDFHDIIWESVENNINDTRADVLVIFDCCHAGQLGNVRGNNHRAFEYLAATSAYSTTRSPGRKSFTRALIWSLDHLLEKQTRFTLGELVRTIYNDAPHFPKKQCPMIFHGQDPVLRFIMIAPLIKETHEIGERPLIRGVVSNSFDDEYDASSSTATSLYSGHSSVADTSNSVSSYSSVSDEPRRDAALHIADMLFRDKGFRPLYLDATRRLRLEVYQQAHNRILRYFLDEAINGAQSPSHATVLRHLQNERQRKRITETLWQLANSATDPEAKAKMDLFLDQRVDRRNRLNALLAGQQKEPQHAVSATGGVDLVNAEEDESHDGISDVQESEESEYLDPENQAQDLRHLQSIEFTLTRSDAYPAFRTRLQYLVNPPRTLSGALASRDIIVVTEFLNKYDTHPNVIVSSSILNLREIGVSKRGIAALLQEDPAEFIETEFFSNADQAEWYKRLADRLGDRFSKTDNAADLDDIGLILEAANDVSSLRNPDTQIGQLDASKGKNVKTCIFQWEIPAVFLDKDQVSIPGRNISDELNNFVTIVGSSGVFEASTCAQYAKTIFGKSGEHAIKAVASVLDFSDLDRESVAVVYDCKNPRVKLNKRIY